MRELLDTALEASAILFLLTAASGVGTICVLIIWGRMDERRRAHNGEQKP